MTTNHKFGVGEYTMRNGRSATVYEIEKGTGRLLGAYTGHDGGRYSVTWRNHGQFLDTMKDEIDLMPPLRKVWINIHEDGFIGRWHRTKEEAVECGRYTCSSIVACIEVEIPA